jgi:hypothetical protein
VTRVTEPAGVVDGPCDWIVAITTEHQDLVKTVKSNDMPVFWIGKRSISWLYELVNVSVSCTLWITCQAICLFVSLRRFAPRAYTGNLGSLRVRTP